MAFLHNLPYSVFSTRSYPTTQTTLCTAKPQNSPSNNNSNPQFTPQKRKRGRPKGSKSNNTSPTPPPQVSPFISAVRDDLRRRSNPANPHRTSAILDSDQPHLAAPNGLPHHDAANTDLLQELLPILSQQEAEENRVITDEEKRVKQLISTCYTQFSSVHRSSDRLHNLKPYKMKQKSQQDCPACSGSGMTVCAYCDGQGYVDLGENAKNFSPIFRNNELTMPKHVMGNTYHCPLCGGLQQERCATCFGTGTASGEEEVVTGASKDSNDTRAWKIFDLDDLIRQEADRIEIGLDGTIIMRAKPRGRPKKTSERHDKNVSAPVRRRRGRPPKSFHKDVTIAKQGDGDGEAAGAELTHDLQPMTSDTAESSTGDGDHSLITAPGAVGIPRGRPVMRTTDFVNTTDYQVGRQLQRQSPTVGQSFPDPHDLGNAASQEKQDGVEELNDIRE